jgi:hypothetical protein
MPPEPARSGGEALAPELRSRAETRFGHDFSRVRIHADSAAAGAAAALGARALTIGNDILFGSGRFAPHEPEGVRLLAHELSHVVQNDHSRSSPKPGIAPAGDPAECQARAWSDRILRGRDDAAVIRKSPEPGHAVMRQEAGDAAAAPEPDYVFLAFEVFDAMEGLGTDEERVYRALEQLRKDPERIRKFRAAYAKHGDLEEDIDDDFSSSEREYVLQLLNKGEAGTAQELVAGKAAKAELPELVRRVRSAFHDEMGTDEEAVFAQLVRLDHDPDLIAEFEAEYLRLSDGEEFRTTLDDEMSEDEEEYQHALYLLSAPYDHWLRRANQKLRGVGFGIPWGAYCGPEPSESKYPDAFDDRYWEQVDDVRNGNIVGCKLKLKTDVRPSEAVTALVEEQDRWAIDCAGFVQIAHWYAMLHVVGPSRFDGAVGGPFELKKERSTGVHTEATFKAHRPGEAMEMHVVRDGALVKDPEGGSHDPAAVLKRAPVGSRVMWTNLLFMERPRLGDEKIQAASEFENENTIKLGPDQYGAFPLREGARTAMSRDEIEVRMAEVAADAYDMSIEDIRGRIFISEIELIEPATGRGPLP